MGSAVAPVDSSMANPAWICLVSKAQSLVVIGGSLRGVVCRR